MPLGGFLCEYGFDGGWPSIFYVIGSTLLILLEYKQTFISLTLIIKGLIGLVWCLLWFILVSDSPSNHRFINGEEREYILDATAKSVSKNEKYVELLI